jgi:protein O-mannosyl-transferase
VKKTSSSREQQRREARCQFVHDGSRWRVAVLCLALALGTFIVFGRVLECDYVNCDDPDYVTSNPEVLGGLTLSGAAWAFRTTAAGNWHPLTWLSHMLDVSLFGVGARGPHLLNLLLHVASTVLLFLLLRQFTGAIWRSALVAALFAVHPLHVESVAWISERKDVLSTFFGLLTVCEYGRYARKRAGTGTMSRTSFFRGWVLDYSLALLFFAFGLMSKPMLVTLPFVLLLLDYWPLNRMSGAGSLAPNAKKPSLMNPEGSRVGLRRSVLLRLSKEKIPFFLLSAISCAVTFLAQKAGGAVQPFSNLPLELRIENALVAYARYLGKTFWPADLCVIYPLPDHWPLGLVLFSASLVCVVSAVAGVLARRFPFLPVGWFWFLGTLIPVIGLVQVGAQSMADRYTYLPLTGIFIMLVLGIGEAVARLRLSRLGVIGVGAAATALVGTCAMLTRDQVSYWRDSGTLFRHAIAVSRKNYIAYDALGSYLYERGLVDEAADNYRAALKINPAYADAQSNLGVVLADQGRFDEAIQCYLNALRLNPNLADAHNNLGNALRHRERLEDAIVHYHRALQISPSFAAAYVNLGNALVQQGQFEQAIDQYRTALQIRADFAEAHFNLGAVLVRLGRREEGIAQMLEALRLKPDYTQARRQLRDLGVEVPE